MRENLTHWLSLVIFLFFAPCLTQAACDSTRTGHSLKAILLHDGCTVVHDVVDLAKSPRHFDGRDGLYTGAIIAGTAVLFTIDEPVRDWVGRQHGKVQDQIAKIGNDYLPSTEIGPVIWFGGLLIGNESIRMAGLEMFESLTFAAAITNALKFSFGRGRPYLDQGAFQYRPFHGGVNWASLPSGHATAAFAMYSALAAHLHTTWASIGLYGLASVTGFSRLYVDDHWTSDVFLGAAIGTVIGNAIVQFHEKRDAKSCWEVGLMPGGVRVGVRF